MSELDNIRFGAVFGHIVDIVLVHRSNLRNQQCVHDSCCNYTSRKGMLGMSSAYIFRIQHSAYRFTRSGDVPLHILWDLVS